ncbi:MAG TPA: ribonuclease J [Bacilli bacterium]|nr:ribonuclease J [Bacilli bacterium]HPX84380.1 ribonuclease J [Bacilli bacterium]HQC73989.1 ribonuclease J [Bacilli bacterium]
MERFNDNNIKIFALGGLDEIGKNMYVVECDQELIIIDAGIMFPGDNYGIDYIIPDYTYLMDNVDKIIGLFITHGHEDHIGGIPYLLRKVSIPKIYASGIAVGLIKNKLSEFSNLSPNIIEYHNDSVFKFQNFEISFFKTNHSIPDSSGIAIKTNQGYILHTGDFKFDFTPLSGHTEYAKLTKYATEGVLCLLSDSTNAQVKKFTTSEKKIGDSIKAIFKQIKGRIIISTFASNVHRVQQIVEASVEQNRKVIVFGRSMAKVVNFSLKYNYITAPPGTFITAKEFPHLPPEKITILSTGSQGEPLAALSRIADGSHKQIKIIPGDTIVFSSSPIPGNQEYINRTINKLFKAGANVIVNSPLTDTHTSGHASETELKIMLSLTKPKHFMPIHGEYAMLKRHAQLAIATGVDPQNIHILDNGEVLTFAPNKVFTHYAVKAGAIYVDSNNEDVDNSIIRERKLMSDDGMLGIVFSTLNYKLMRLPNVVSRGFIYVRDSEALVTDIENKAKELYENYYSETKKFNPNQFYNLLLPTLADFIYEKTERKPMIVPIIMNV